MTKPEQSDIPQPFELDPFQLDADDLPVGTILSRRRALGLLGLGGLGVVGGLAGAQKAATVKASRTLPSCVVRPQMTEGPFWVDEQLLRRDVRSDSKTRAVQPGLPLELGFLISRVGAGGCQPLSGVLVDIWQCSALGQYSDVSGMGNGDTQGQDWLRGQQRTDAAGRASFVTVWPGWYPGRATHIHFQLRYGNSEFVSQLFFDEATTDAVYAGAKPYISKGSSGRMRNASDGIYRNGGNQLLLKTTGSVAKGYAGVMDIGMNVG
jgi:protocatechuate 3,4-dioxygenase beta subunit